MFCAGVGGGGGGGGEGQMQGWKNGFVITMEGVKMNKSLQDTEKRPFRKVFFVEKNFTKQSYARQKKGAKRIRNEVGEGEETAFF